MQNFALFAGSCLKNDPSFLDFTNAPPPPPPLRNTPFFAKMDTSMVYALVGSGGGGGGIGVDRWWLGAAESRCKDI